MGFLSQLSATVAAIVGAVAGLIVGIALAAGITVFHYRGLSLPIPFSTRSLTIFDGEIGKEMKVALKGYVAEAEKTALNAAIEKKARDLAIAEKANEKLRNQLDESDKAHEDETAKMEQDIKTYETLLATSGRACPLGDGDKQWMLGHSPSPAQ